MSDSDLKLLTHHQLAHAERASDAPWTEHVRGPVTDEGRDELIVHVSWGVARRDNGPTRMPPGGDRFRWNTTHSFMIIPSIDEAAGANDSADSARQGFYSPDPIGSKAGGELGLVRARPGGAWSSLKTSEPLGG